MAGHPQRDHGGQDGCFPCLPLKACAVSVLAGGVLTLVSCSGLQCLFSPSFLSLVASEGQTPTCYIPPVLNLHPHSIISKVTPFSQIPALWGPDALLAFRRKDCDATKVHTEVSLAEHAPASAI